MRTRAVTPGTSRVVQPRQIQCLCAIGNGSRFLVEVFTKCLAALQRAIIGIETSTITEDRWFWASRAFSWRRRLVFARPLLRLKSKLTSMLPECQR
jgi:hypothetical protein